MARGRQKETPEGTFRCVGVDVIAAASKHSTPSGVPETLGTEGVRINLVIHHCRAKRNELSTACPQQAMPCPERGRKLSGWEPQRPGRGEGGLERA
jgi:hypothetical protein